MGRAAGGLRKEVTVGEWLGQASARLAKVGSNEARAEASLLLRHATGLSKAALLASPNSPAPEALEGLLARRLRGEPVAYIVGSREFYGREFAVSPAVLVPRHETETLVDAALFRSLEPGSRVLDVGTGSGCLAVTLALERPDLKVFASDVSQSALDVAVGNAARLGARVDLRAGDLFEPWGGERFDLMVSNPPYVAVGDELPAEVAGFEPEVALYAGEDGLAFYRRLASEAAGYLDSEAALLLEAGDRAAARVEEIFVGAGWRTEGWRDDLMGMPRAGTFLPPSLGPSESE